MAPPSTLTERIVAAVEGSGPMTFDRFVDLALYDPDGGFFATSGGAGRAGADFLTSPEVGPLFGAVVARALDQWWAELGRPDPFTVVEAGAGRGALARSVLAAGPECAGALRYVAVERTDRLRAELAQVTGVDVRSELPDEQIDGVVLANELLDNVPFRLLERVDGDDRWAEVGVGVEEGRLHEVQLPVDAGTAERIGRLAPDARPSDRVPLQDQAAAWLRHALTLVRRGRVLVIDYADDTPGLARRPVHEWLRTYRGHAPGAGPLEAVGDQDITVEVAVDQLAEVEVPAVDRSQAEFLADHGLDDLVADGRRVWQERAHLGDLEALRARSRINEAEALADPTGLGAFRVLEWTR